MSVNQIDVNAVNERTRKQQEKDEQTTAEILDKIRASGGTQ